MGSSLPIQATAKLTQDTLNPVTLHRPPDFARYRNPIAGGPSPSAFEIKKGQLAHMALLATPVNAVKFGILLDDPGVLHLVKKDYS